MSPGGCSRASFGARAALTKSVCAAVKVVRSGTSCEDSIPGSGTVSTRSLHHNCNCVLYPGGGTVEDSSLSNFSPTMAPTGSPFGEFRRAEYSTPYEPWPQWGMCNNCRCDITQSPDAWHLSFDMESCQSEARAAGASFFTYAPYDAAVASYTNCAYSFTCSIITGTVWDFKVTLSALLDPRLRFCCMSACFFEAVRSACC